MNLYEARLTGGALALGGQTLQLPPSVAGDPALREYDGRELVAGIRPEHLADAALEGDAPEAQVLEGEVDVVEALGAEKLIHFRTDVGRVQLADALAEATGDAATLGEGEVGQTALSASVARVAPESALEPGDRARFLVQVSRLHLFDAETGAAVVHAR